jgi:alpha-beta hydrolase superfamily lysophospholipase
MKRYNFFKYVKEGIAVVTIEYEGHGRSDGPLCLIPDFNQTVTDVVEFFYEVSQQRFPTKKCFLMGEVSTYACLIMNLADVYFTELVAHILSNSAS